MENKLQVIREQEIEACLIELRGQKVLLDRDVAILYGVETKRVNEAVRNNPDKFPKDYIIELNESEIRYLRSKISTTNLSSKVRAVPKAFYACYRFEKSPGYGYDSCHYRIFCPFKRTLPQSKYLVNRNR